MSLYTTFIDDDSVQSSSTAPVIPGSGAEEILPSVESQPVCSGISTRLICRITGLRFSKQTPLDPVPG